MNKNVFDLSGRTAVITGGGSGLGFGIARVFTEYGARVVIIGQNEEKLKSACAELGETSSYVQFDITCLDRIPGVMQDIYESSGSIDILVNCAGKHLKKDVFNTTDDEYLDILKVHLLASFSLTREAAKYMKSSGGGSVIMISSMSSVMSMEKVVAYSTAKTSVLGLMRGVISEFAPYNIRVNAIAPGWIETPMLHKAIDNDPSRRARILNRIPVHEFGFPDDIGYAALYLASDAGKYVNGVFLPVDGGATTGF